MVRDLKNAARALAGARTFTFAAVLALAIAIGANGAIFALVDALWFRPPGVRDAATIVRVYATNLSERDAPWSWPEFEDVGAHASSFDDVAVRGRRGAMLTAGDGTQELLLVNVVSTNFFEMLGVRPAVGRLFGPDDERTLEAAPAAVLGHAFWQNYFGGDPAIVGRTIQLGRGRPVAVTIMGVLPASFRDLEASADRDLWLPPQTWVRIGGDRREFEARDDRWFEMVARRRANVTVERAGVEMATLARTFAADFPSTNAGRGARVVSDRTERLERGGVAAKAMLALVLLIVLITCVNVANLLLARASARSQDLAVRLALGAPRWRLVRQLAAESLILGGLGALGGLIVASWLIRLLPALMTSPPGMRAMVVFATDGRVVLFTAAVTVLTTVLTGLAPAWFGARTDLVTTIKSATGASTRGGALRRVLVVAQVAISLVLLCVSIDLARSFVAASTSDLGFKRQGILTLWTTFGSNDRDTSDEAVRQLDALPGVDEVAVAIRAPLSLSGGGLALPVSVPGAPHDARRLPEVKFNAVSANYFDVLGTKVVRGRPFTSDEQQAGELTVVVSEQFARQFFAGRNPLGERIVVAAAPYRIVGIAQDAVVNEIGEDPQPYMYLPYSRGSYGEQTFLLETAGSPGAIASAARATLRRVHAGLEPRRMITMADYVEFAASLHRTTAALACLLAIVGLVLTAVGVYGVVAYQTNRRSKEIGIRMALGAFDRQVMRLVLRDGMGLGLVGVAAGLPLALAATKMVASMLVGVTPWHAASFAGAGAILLAAIAAATMIPAWRATRIEAARALRSV
jgi:predicted permease